MSDIYVVGHKNPDSDSVCSAYAYAKLKNLIDKRYNYAAARCGSMNKQTKFIFDKFEAESPVFVKDVYPKVGDVMTRKVIAIDENEPLATVLKNIEELKIRITPVVSNANKYKGIVSILEISEFFASGDLDTRPEYLLRAENFEKTISGYFFRRGEQEEFKASVMIGAMPFDRFKTRLDSIESENAVLIVGKRRDIIEYAVEKQLPAIILTGMKDEADVDIDFSDYKGWVYVSDHDTAETLRKLHLSIPTKSIMMSNIHSVSEKQYLDAVKDLMMGIDHKGLPVLQDERLIGIITRSDLIKKAQRRLVLMDHNELGQAVDGAETALITEIVDHHRLGTIKTNVPIHFYAKPVGSTCTLVYQQYVSHGVDIDKMTASVLLSGVLSDTVILKSPTTTKEDVEAVNELSAIAELDYKSYGVELFSATDSLKTRKASDIIGTDFKIYEEFGIKVGIGQVEVVTLAELDEVKEDLINGLDTILKEKGLNWSMLLVTDIIMSESVLLTSGFEAGEQSLAYKPVADRQFHLPNVLSRKKQLLPEILRVLEEISD